MLPVVRQFQADNTEGVIEPGKTKPKKKIDFALSSLRLTLAGTPLVGTPAGQVTACTVDLPLRTSARTTQAAGSPLPPARSSTRWRGTPSRAIGGWHTRSFAQGLGRKQPRRWVGQRGRESEVGRACPKHGAPDQACWGLHHLMTAQRVKRAITGNILPLLVSGTARTLASNSAHALSAP